MANWWDRLTYAVGSFGDRVAESAGIFDVADEMSRYDDGDMSALDWVKTIGNTAWQVKDLPLSTLATGAHLVNQGMGTGLREVSSNPVYALNPLLRLNPWDDRPAFNAEVVEDFFTGGIDPQTRAIMEEQARASATPEQSLAMVRGQYTPITASDALFVGTDKAVNRYGKGIVALAPWYNLGNALADKEGIQSNSSYLPRSFDMWAQDAGLQLWEQSDARPHLILSQVVVESIVDPLNWAAGPIASSLGGLKAARLVGSDVMPDSALVAQTFDVVSNGGREQSQWLRARQWIPGRGRWDPHRVLKEMATNPNQLQLLKDLAGTTDEARLFRFYRYESKMAPTDEGAALMASWAKQLDDPGDIAAMHYAASYRDNLATDRFLAALDSKVGSFPAANAFKAQAGLGDNALESVAYRFGDGELPDGHLLKLEAKPYIDYVLDTEWAATNPAPGMNNHFREAWEKLIKEDQDEIVRELGNQRRALSAGQQFQRDATAFPMERMLNTRGNRGQYKLAKAGQRGDQRPAVGVAEWLTKPIPAFSIRGRSSRTSPSVWLMSRPGLTFALHDMNAAAKFDDLIHYGDGLLGPSPTGGPRLIEDPRILELQDQFRGAPAWTKNPEQTRAQLVDDLQQYLLTRIATNRGADPAAAAILADLGMQKGRRVADSMNTIDSGYTTMLVEDGIPVVYGAGPSTLRQTANHVPIMDLKAVDDALKSKGLQSFRAYIHSGDDELLSITTKNVQDQLDLVSRGGKRSGAKQLDRVGRGPVSRARHDVLDVADIVNSIFKGQVLLRLGYPVRNVSEAWLSTFASGVGWLSVMRAAGASPRALDFMSGNFLNNAVNSPMRGIDRWQSATGRVVNEDAWRSAAEGVAAGQAIANNNLINAINLVSDPTTMMSLLNRVKGTDPTDVAIAQRELDYVVSLRLVAAQQLNESDPLVRDGWIAADAAQGDTVHHADITGTFNGEIDPTKLTRPISAVADRVVGQGGVESAWTAADDWRKADIAPGKVIGSWQVPPGKSPLQPQALADLHAAQVAAGAKPKWRVAKDGTLTFTSAAGRDEFVAALDAAQAAPKPGLPVVKPATTDPVEQFWVKMTGTKGATGTPEQVAALNADSSAPGLSAQQQMQTRATREQDLLQVAADAKPGTHIWRSEVLSQSPHETGVTGIHWSVNPDGVVPVSSRQLRPGQTAVVWHAQVEPDTTVFPRSHAIWQGKHRSMGHEAEVRLKPGSNIRVLGVRIGDDYFKINRRVVAEHKPNGQFYTISYSDIDEIANAAPVTAPTVASLAEQRAAHARTQAVLRNLRRRVDNASRWRVRQQELAQAAKTGHVQFRVNSNSSWVDWSGPLPYKGGKHHNDYQFRTVPKSGPGKPGTVEMQVWGPELDLTDLDMGIKVADRYAHKMDYGTMNAAQLGDRAAQERISNILAEEGFYRLKFTEKDPKWNDEHLLIHPKGIGDEAFARLVRKHVETLTKLQTRPDDFMVQHLQENRALAKVANKGGAVKLPKDTLPESVTASTSPTQILQRGGFEAVLEEAIEMAKTLRGQQEAIAAAYVQRRGAVAKRAKRGGGTPPAVLALASRYKGAYLVQDPLHGGDGGAFAQITSGNLTQATQFGTASIHADLMSDMSRAQMNPEYLHPGDPRFFEGSANLLGRQYRDLPGAVTPAGATRKDVDPVFAMALREGDRQRLEDETIAWVLNTPQGREWMAGLNLKPADSVDEAKAAADAAMARRGDIPLSDGDFRRHIEQNWNDGLKAPSRVDVADVVRATFNFAETHLPTPAAKELFLSGELNAKSLRELWEVEQWDRVGFNGLVVPSHPAFRRLAKQQAQNDSDLNGLTQKYTQFLSWALQKIGSGPETRLARHPVYQSIASKDLQQRVTFFEQTQGRPLTLDELLTMRTRSQKFAVKKMEETLYTLKTRSAVDDFARFVFPFFPAWRNTMHRWGKFAIETPGHAARVPRLYNSVFGEMPWYDSATGEEVDPKDVKPGQEVHILAPGIGSWLMGWADDPVMKEAQRRTKLTKQSVDVIFQGRPFNPGFGPMVTIPVQALFDRWAEVTDGPVGRQVASWFQPVGPSQTGSTALDAISALLPSAAKPFFNKYINAQSYMSYYNRVQDTYLANEFHLNPDGSAKSPEQIDKEVSTAATKLMGIKTLMYLTSPVSAQQIGDHEFYAGQMRSLMETAPDSHTAEDHFLDRFGADKFWYTESSTVNLTGGMATAAVVANQKANQELAFEATSEYGDPRLLGFFDNLGPDGETMPYDPDEYNSYARNWQLKNSPGTSEEPYRGTKGASARMRDVKEKLGWRYYDYGMGLLDLQLQKEGYVPGSPPFIKERGTRASQVAGQVAQLVPEWAASRDVVNTGKTENNAEFFNWAVNSSDWVKQGGRSDWAVIRSIRGYLADRETVRSKVEAAKAMDPSVGSTSASQAHQYWAMWLRTRREMYAQGSASFEGWVNQYFRNDAVAYTPVTGTPLEELLP